MWGYVVTSLPILVLAAIPVYCLGSALSAYFVCQRTSKQHLVVGAKTAIVTFFLGIFMIGFTDFNIDLLILLFVCYLVGGVGGSYLALKKQLDRGKTISAAP